MEEDEEPLKKKLKSSSSLSSTPSKKKETSGIQQQASIVSFFGPKKTSTTRKTETTTTTKKKPVAAASASSPPSASSTTKTEEKINKINSNLDTPMKIISSRSSSSSRSSTIPQSVVDKKKSSSSPPPSEAAAAAKKATATDDQDKKHINLDPIIPEKISKAIYGDDMTTWRFHNELVLVRQVRQKNKNNNNESGSKKSTLNVNNTSNKRKIAAYDLDGTLLVWRTAGWPSKFDDYELWSNEVINKIREVYDNGYDVVIISNQGGIRNAITGKKATTVKSIIEWLESIIRRPMQVVLSTKSPNAIESANKKKKSGGEMLESHHKPNPKLWQVAMEQCFGFRCCCSSTDNDDGRRMTIDMESSFFVGDSADLDDPQGGVDIRFSQNVSHMMGKQFKFYTPQEYFGPSNDDKRKRGIGASDTATGPERVPQHALSTRMALSGGYLYGPILLILCGVQGSGKSTFCNRVLGIGTSSNNENDNDNSQQHWIHLSQDTINNGKSGKREQVETAALSALQNGHSVLIDRMHLDPSQRSHFIELGKRANVGIHILVLNPSIDIATRRVRDRTNHPTNVQGEQGSKVVKFSANKLIIPTYNEGRDCNDTSRDEKIIQDSSSTTAIQLISVATTPAFANRLADQYKRVVSVATTSEAPTATATCSPRSIELASGCGGGRRRNLLPMITLGTMNIGKTAVSSVLSTAFGTGRFRAIDTAPTYNNEERIGDWIIEQQQQGKKNNKKRKQNPAAAAAVAAATATDDVDDEDDNDDGLYCIVKVPKRVTDATSVRSEVEQSLKKLRRSYADLLLLHWPCSDVTQLMIIWKEMESIYRDGICNGLGVCNFNIDALSILLMHCTIPPCINQIERHPLLPQIDLIDYCTSKHDIIIQAHTTLGGKIGKMDILENPIIKQISKETGHTPCQIIIQWNIQHGIPSVVKAANKHHQDELVMCMESSSSSLTLLSAKHMKLIDNITTTSNTKTKRFVAPPFMYGNAPFCWGKTMPSSKKK